ncbi:MAG: PhoU domain-containing protein [Thermodesulfobacteriota bacterium]
MPIQAESKEISVQDEILRMFDLTKEMLDSTWEGFRRQNMEKLHQAEVIGREIHDKEKVLTSSIMNELPRKEGSSLEELLIFLPTHLERIGDDIELVIRSTRSIIKEGVCFSDKAIKEINTLFAKAEELLESTRNSLTTEDRGQVNRVREEGIKFQEMVGEYSLSHYDRLIEGTCMPKASSIYLAILDYLSDIEKHIRKIADRI